MKLQSFTGDAGGRAIKAAMVIALVSTVFAVSARAEDRRSAAPPVPPDPRLVGRPHQQHGKGAWIPVVVIDGVLTVFGYDFSEKIQVTLTQNEISLVYSFDLGEGVYSPGYGVSYPVEEIVHIFVILNGGNDTFINYTAVDCTVYGGPGNDVIVGGESADVIYGEEGGDTLFGGGGPDLIEGGPQSDVLCGGRPFESPTNSLIDLGTVTFLFAKLTLPWIYAGHHVDYEVDTLRGGPEDPDVDADWFIREVVPDEWGDPVETDVILDMKVNMDWETFNGHFWE